MCHMKAVQGGSRGFTAFFQPDQWTGQAVMGSKQYTHSVAAAAADVTSRLKRAMEPHGWDVRALHDVLGFGQGGDHKAMDWKDAVAKHREVGTGGGEHDGHIDVPITWKEPLAVR